MKISKSRLCSRRSVCNLSSISSLRCSCCEPESALFIHFRIVSCFMTEIGHTNSTQRDSRTAQFNLKMSRDFFFPRFHVQVFVTGTYLLSAIVVDAIFAIDLPSFSRLNELKICFWKERDAREKRHSLGKVTVVCAKQKWKFL